VKLEFTLPSGSAGMAAGMTKHAIEKKLKKLMIDYTVSEHRGYKFCIELEPKQYTMMCLKWSTENPWHRWRVLEP
jgi:hypothetical protein